MIYVFCNYFISARFTLCMRAIIVLLFLSVLPALVYAQDARGPALNYIHSLARTQSADVNFRFATKSFFREKPFTVQFHYRFSRSSDPSFEFLLSDSLSDEFYYDGVSYSALHKKRTLHVEKTSADSVIDLYYSNLYPSYYNVPNLTRFFSDPDVVIGSIDTTIHGKECVKFFALEGTGDNSSSFDSHLKAVYFTRSDSTLLRFESIAWAGNKGRCSFTRMELVSGSFSPKSDPTLKNYLEKIHRSYLKDNYKVE